MKQQQEIERIRFEHPSFLERHHLSNPDMILARIGVMGFSPDRPRGYLRYVPDDMIVEECWNDGSVCGVRPTRSIPDAHKTGKILHGNLIKTGLSTSDALDRLAEAIQLPKSQIMHTGAKDRRAVTSQRVSIDGVEWNRVGVLDLHGAFFEPLFYDTCHLSYEELSGHRFTMMVRHDGTEDRDRLKLLADVSTCLGFFNFFPPGVFGARTLSHKLGCLLLRGDVEGVLRAFFIESGPDDLPVFRGTRERLAGSYGDWNFMHEIASVFPGTFALELRVLESLIKDPKKTRQALRSIQNELKNWVRAYQAWLFNRVLSRALVSHQTLDEKLSLNILKGSFDELVRFDETINAKDHLETFGLRVKEEDRLVRVRPDIHRIMQQEEGTRFVVSLPRDVDLHAMLSHFYRLHEGRPIPGWVKV